MNKRFLVFILLVWFGGVYAQKKVLSKNELSIKIKTILEEIQNNLFNQAKEFRNKNTHDVKTYDEFKNNVLRNETNYVGN